MLGIVEEYRKVPKAEKYVRERYGFLPLRFGSFSPAVNSGLTRRLQGPEQSPDPSPNLPLCFPLGLNLLPCHRGGQFQHSSKLSSLVPHSQNLSREM